MLYATIMAGGSGTRFWPASRRDKPKQLLNLVGDGSMLQATTARLSGLCENDQILILTNQRLVEATRSQLPALPADCFIGEPCKRDTAPCIGVAAAVIAAKDPDATMLVMPADHVIQQVDQFHSAVKRGEQLLQTDPGRLVTFGIKPTYPAQVFGYIERDQSIGDGAYQVKQFREKPELETATSFVESGNFYWNAGIFMWKANTILNSLEKFEPEMFHHIKKIGMAVGTEEFNQVFEAEFTAIKGKSIDFAVMERHPNICVLEAPFDWDDVGNWTAVPRLSGMDEAGNSTAGNQLCIDTSNSVVRSTDDHLVVTLGVDNCIVIHTPDATLVADKSDESAIKKVVTELEKLGWENYL